MAQDEDGPSSPGDLAVEEAVGRLAGESRESESVRSDPVVLLPPFFTDTYARWL